MFAKLDSLEFFPLFLLSHRVDQDQPPISILFLLTLFLSLFLSSRRLGIALDLRHRAVRCLPTRCLRRISVPENRIMESIIRLNRCEYALISWIIDQKFNRSWNSNGFNLLLTLTSWLSIFMLCYCTNLYNCFILKKSVFLIIIKILVIIFCNEVKVISKAFFNPFLFELYSFIYSSIIYIKMLL